MAFERMDGALLGCIQIEKAYTSAVLGISTADEGKLAQPSQPEYGVNTIAGRRYVILGRGVSIIHEKKIVGAVGCSSGTVDQNAAVAQAGVVPSSSAWFEEWMVSAMHGAADIQKSTEATYETLKAIRQ
jgi:uncharacterized protein GlcG (DUF336 family)